MDNKNQILSNVPFLKKKISVPEDANDNEITEKNFIESILDHCTYSSLKNIKNPDTNKKMVFKKFDKCKIKLLNEKNLNDLTLEKFTELENKKKKKNNKEIKEKSENSKTENKKIENDKKKKINIVKTKEKYPVFFRWQKLPYTVISTLTLRKDNTGIININFHETKEDCIGSIAINSGGINGNWSMSCPDNQKRIGVFKKKLGASGTLKIDDGIIIGDGFDSYRNKIKFVSTMN